MRRITALLASLALLLTLFSAATLAAPSATGTWIVTLRAGADPVTDSAVLARQQGGTVGHVYQHGTALTGSRRA